jgi:hypothetical protein
MANEPTEGLLRVNTVRTVPIVLEEERQRDHGRRDKAKHVIDIEVVILGVLR